MLGGIVGSMPAADANAIATGGGLIPARLLVNGGSIRQDFGIAAIGYHHVELDAHDVLIAEGLPCESFLDTGNRGAFEGGGAALELHPDFARAEVDTGFIARHHDDLLSAEVSPGAASFAVVSACYLSDLTQEHSRESTSSEDRCSPWNAVDSWRPNLAGALTLDWSDAAPVPDHYEIQIASDANFTIDVRNYTSVPSTYTLTDELPANATYYWRVRARSADGGWGVWSKVFSFSADAPAVPVPWPTAWMTTAPASAPARE